MALATLSLGFSLPLRQASSELDAVLDALEKNNPEDAAAARPGSGSDPATADNTNNPSKRRQLDDGDVDSILAALQGTDAEDAAAAGQGQVPGKRATNAELEAILDALNKNNPEDAAAAAGQGDVPDKRESNEDIEAVLDALEKNNPEDAAEADGVLP
ncbi:hypothetical protein PG993_004086 [Apiospora rasikravindrae]|uniref:Uncharacterized protein n=1 Tax=Apiospora rasikravindrae TaxID=990691 RepID=A0ABR1TCB9_9PEZI